ncbi:vacuolar membrane PQ loop repeat protein-like protein [Cucurbitaria berberidis CBS 394.84]|uniref:Vacuolar membrane PQ loop repeat protein-like protein n=1 Tax=Cucurbitaria berberidis CBS 394.84 TaxID=1168544 RepID=A0A9P4LDD4_9PLEO|nr:vacuolar membrane PQ loop repeat protein-like protein [Cucurbitaria berberidis CBS 394.84]KAF1849994.1 vacuolar membrane PQ loop repeat protein-like protein [Cucurbitaria berberidis CBS 394.84]
MAQSPPLTALEALSGVFGSISLASWIFLLVPQLLENYKSGSADGISLAFLTVWFIGDITNLAGATWAGLVPTVIALAIYFCFADLILISQCVYYNMKNSKRTRKTSTRSQDSVEAPLLGRRDSSNIGLPGSHRRDSAASRRRRASSLPTIMDVDEGGSEWIKNALSIIGVCVVGAAGWAIAWKTGVWVPQPTNKATTGTEMALGAQVLGYASALCYLGARIPQIIKNQREKSCEGLSLLFFMLSLLGNATYGAGIIFHSTEKEYMLTNLPWLIGSLGTMVEDVTIFIQFRVFGSGESTSALA